MKANELIAALEKKLDTENADEVSLALGVTVATLKSWKDLDVDLSAAQLAAALVKSQETLIKQVQHETIWPIIEFFKIDKCPSSRNAKWNVFDGSKNAGRYQRGLREQLEKSRGIYIFYDSRGHALYVGKACQQSLWKELNDAFNRPRGEVQKIKLTQHPKREQDFKPGYEKLRRIEDRSLALSDLAQYLSVYDVDDGMIDDLETLMIRGFANNLLNVKMETFAHSRS